MKKLLRAQVLLLAAAGALLPVLVVARAAALWTEAAVAGYLADPSAQAAAAVAQVHLGALTLLTAIASLAGLVVIARAALQAVEQAGRSAEAARESAETAKSILRGVEARPAGATLPYVIFTHAERSADAGKRAFELELHLRNVGVGPALNLRATVRHGLHHETFSAYALAAYPALGPNEAGSLQIGFGDAWGVAGYPRVPNRAVDARAIAEYRDAAGAWWRTDCALLIHPPAADRAAEVPIALDAGSQTVAEVPGPSLKPTAFAPYFSGS